jgi:DnaJ-domain-containing protein 1
MNEEEQLAMARELKGALATLKHRGVRDFKALDTIEKQIKKLEVCHRPL